MFYGGKFGALLTPQLMKHIHILLLVTLSLPSLFAQNDTEKVVTQVSLQEQYKALKSELEVIDGVRMIKVYEMDRVWKVVIDSMQEQKSKVRELAGKIEGQQKEILALNNSIKKLESEKETLAARVDNILVFGKAYSKAGFVIVISFVILGLLVLTGILFAVGRTALNTSRELRKLNENLYQEFDTYKRHAVEKEIKISRELQNHRNKLAELKMA